GLSQAPEWRCASQRFLIDSAPRRRVALARADCWVEMSPLLPQPDPCEETLGLPERRHRSAVRDNPSYSATGSEVSCNPTSARTSRSRLSRLSGSRRLIRSGRLRAVLRRASSRRQRSIAAWCPDSSIGGTSWPRQTGGLV